MGIEHTHVAGALAALGTAQAQGYEYTAGLGMSQYGTERSISSSSWGSRSDSAVSPRRSHARPPAVKVTLW